MTYPTPTRSVVRLIAPSLVILVVGIVAGVLWLIATPTAYSAETRVAIGQSNISSSQVPGYTAAEATLASNYSRLLQDTQSERSQIGTEGEPISAVAATPIPESSVIRIQVTASSAAAAESGAAKAATRMKSLIDDANGDVATAEKAFRSAYGDYITAKTAAQTATNKANHLLSTVGPNDPGYVTAREAVDKTAADEAVLNLKQLTLGSSYQTAFTNARNASVTLLGPVGPAVSNKSSTLQKTLGVPVILALAIGLAVVYIRWRRAEHPRSDRAA